MGMEAGDLRAESPSLHDLDVQAEAMDAAQRSRDGVFWWRCHVLDTACAWGRNDSQQCGQHRAHAPSHRVRDVAPVDRAWPLADTAVCHQAAGESRVPPGFLFAQHVPTVEARSDDLAREESGQSRVSV